MVWCETSPVTALDQGSLASWLQSTFRQGKEIPFHSTGLAVDFEMLTILDFRVQTVTAFLGHHDCTVTQALLLTSELDLCTVLADGSWQT